MTAPGAPALPPVPQSVTGALTRAAIFLVVTINPGAAAGSAVRSFCGDLAGLVRDGQDAERREQGRDGDP